MYTSIDDVEDPVYSMDFLSPLNYLEFDSSILEWSNTSNTEAVTSTPNDLVLSNGDIKSTKRKRMKSKGDRHSKISTASGLRDRRMRLSLDVARPFFKLQDMLSFDKPSKTVKWLLLQAKSAIEEVDKGSFFSVANSSSTSVSEGEIAESPIDDREIVKEKCGKKRKNDLRSVDKQVRKKLREEARERAKERTKKKIHDRLRLSDQLGGCDHHEDMDLGGLISNESQDSKVFEIEQEIQNGTTAFGTAMDIASNWTSLMSYHQEEDYCQVNPNPEFQQFDGAAREFCTHPNAGHQNWYYG